MERYLGDLSLEYDSVWDTKPVWCQPWTILATGSSAVAGSWALLHWLPLTAVVSALVGVWWYTFLVAYPQAYAGMIAERRRAVSEEREDMYGTERGARRL